MGPQGRLEQIASKNWDDGEYENVAGMLRLQITAEDYSRIRGPPLSDETKAGPVIPRAPWYAIGRKS